MDYQSKGKTTLQSVLILALIGSLISYILPDLFQPIYVWLQSTLSYKSLLIIWLLTTLILLYSLRTTSGSHTTPSKRELKKRKENSEQQQKTIMVNLTEAEKKLLCTFLKQDRKDMFIDSQNGEANSLERSGVLQDAPGRGFGERQYFVKDWAWEYLQANKKEFLTFC